MKRGFEHKVLEYNNEKTYLGIGMTKKEKLNAIKNS